jgi:hypothetical protein
MLTKSKSKRTNNKNKRHIKSEKGCIAIEIIDPKQREGVTWWEGNRKREREVRLGWGSSSAMVPRISCSIKNMSLHGFLPLDLMNGWD